MLIQVSGRSTTPESTTQTLAKRSRSPEDVGEIEQKIEQLRHEFDDLAPEDHARRRVQVELNGLRALLGVSRPSVTEGIKLPLPVEVKRARETSTDFAILCSPEGLQKVVTVNTRAGRGDKQQLMLLNRLITIPLAVAHRYGIRGGRGGVQLLIRDGNVPEKGEVSLTRAWPSLE